MTARMRTTGRLRAVGFDFEIRASPDLLMDWISEVYAPLARPGIPEHSYTLRGDSDVAELFFDGELVARSEDVPYVVGMLLWHVNQRTVAASKDDRVLLHAAVVELAGQALLLPAQMESGKSTLAAGLVREGMRYLSDELAVIHPVTGMVEAYAKPLSIDPGSWGVLAGMAPVLTAGLEAYLPDQWQLPADGIRVSALAREARPVMVVAPTYVAGAGLALERLSVDELLLHLAGCTFDLVDDLARNLRVLQRIADSCVGFRLVFDDLDDACDLLVGLVDHHARPAPGHPRRGQRAVAVAV